MMVDKKSFILYANDLEMLEELTMEERGQLLTAIYSHSTGGEMPEMTSAAKVAFFFVKKSLDRDGKKYEETVSRNRTNGAKGGRPKKKKVEEETDEESDAEHKNPEQTKENPEIIQNNPVVTQIKPTHNPVVSQKNMITDNCYLITDNCTPLSGGNTRARTREDAAWLERLPMILTPQQMSDVDGILRMGAGKDLIEWAIGEAVSRSKGWEYARAILNDKLTRGIRTVDALQGRGRRSMKPRETSYDGEAFDRLGLELPPDAEAMYG